jgi:transcriptional regulator
MQDYIIAALGATLIIVSLMYRDTAGDLEQAKTDLAVADQVNQANRAAIAHLEHSLAVTDKIMDEWQEDRTTLAGVRTAARQAIKEAMRDEMFKAWAAAAAPPDAWRLLHETPDANGNSAPLPSGGVTGGLPGNSDSGKRQ